MKNTRGEIYVTVCVLILIVITVFSVIFTYASAVTLIKVQKTNTEIVFDSFVANNSIIIYNNIKQGNNAISGIDTDIFYSSLKEFCTLDERSGKLYNVNADGSENYNMTVPVIGFIEEEELALTVTYTMYVPIRFAGVTVSVARVPVKISSVLTKK